MLSISTCKKIPQVEGHRESKRRKKYGFSPESVLFLISHLLEETIYEVAIYEEREVKDETPIPTKINCINKSDFDDDIFVVRWHA